MAYTEEGSGAIVSTHQNRAEEILPQPDESHAADALLITQKILKLDILWLYDKRVYKYV